jgi:hypothetical protein
VNERVVRVRVLVIRVLTVAVFGLLPAFALYTVFANVIRDGVVTDFELAFYPAAQAILDGASPYLSPDDPGLASGLAYVYPPLTALASIVLTPLEAGAAGVVVMALLVACVVATLVLLEVRDWRCYGLAFLWPPVISAIQTGNITIPLALGAAIVWRFRDRPGLSGIGLGASLAAKVFLWPLLVWLVATRRLRAGVVAVGVAVGAVLGSWALIGFAGLRDYPELLRRLADIEEPFAYTLYALALDLGVSPELARPLGLMSGILVLAGMVVLARRGDERRAFVLAVAAALACSPIVWLHYFALLLVAVAVAEPKLGPAWFVPLAMYASTGTHNGTTAQTAVTIAAAVLTVLVAIRPRGRPLLAPTVSPVGGRP